MILLLSEIQGALALTLGFPQCLAPWILLVPWNPLWPELSLNPGFPWLLGSPWFLGFPFPWLLGFPWLLEFPWLLGRANYQTQSRSKASPNSLHRTSSLA